MGRVFWTDEAASSFAQLDAKLQKSLREKISHLKDFPNMYQASEDPRFQSCRRFVVRPYYVVYYRVWGEANDCFVIAIRDVRMGQDSSQSAK